MPVGKASTMAQDRRAEQRPPVFGVPRQRVLQADERRGADERPGAALSPPSSTMTRASTERGMASDSGEMLPFENA